MIIWIVFINCTEISQDDIKVSIYNIKKSLEDLKLYEPNLNLNEPSLNLNESVKSLESSNEAYLFDKHLKEIQSNILSDPVKCIKNLTKLSINENIKLKHKYELILSTDQASLDKEIQNDNETINDINKYINLLQADLSNYFTNTLVSFLDTQDLLSSLKNNKHNLSIKDLKESLDDWESDYKKYNQNDGL